MHAQVGIAVDSAVDVPEAAYDESAYQDLCHELGGEDGESLEEALSALISSDVLESVEAHEADEAAQEPLEAAVVEAEPAIPDAAVAMLKDKRAQILIRFKDTSKQGIKKYKRSGQTLSFLTTSFGSQSPQKEMSPFGMKLLLDGHQNQPKRGDLILRFFDII